MNQQKITEIEDWLKSNNFEAMVYIRSLKKSLGQYKRRAIEFKELAEKRKIIIDKLKSDMQYLRSRYEFNA